MRFRRRGARSIRGALGTYTVVSVVAVLLLALALLVWHLLQRRPAPVLVRLEPGEVSGALLEPTGGGPAVELRPGEERAVSPGEYRLRLFGPGGQVREQVLRLTEGASLPEAGAGP